MNCTLSDLYNGKAHLSVKFEGHEVPFSVDLMTSEFKGGEVMRFVDLPDCKVYCWTANRWFRTNKGANYEKYNTIADLKRGITASAKSRGLKVESFNFAKA